MMNFIFWVTIYPSLFLIYFIQKGEGKAKYGTLFGIKYSNEWLSDSELHAFEEEYRHKLNQYCFIFALIPLVTFFIPYTSIYFSVWMLWMLAAIVICMLPYCKGNSKLKVLKKERCPQENAPEIRYAEMKNAGLIRCVKGRQFVPPCVISTVIASIAFQYFSKTDSILHGSIIIILAPCNFLFYAVALYMDKTKTTVISSESDVNVNYTRATKNIFKNFWLQCIWLNILFLVILFLLMLAEVNHYTVSGSVSVWSMVIYSCIIIWLCMKMTKKQQRLARKYAKKMDLIYEDDERHWICGMFYYNPGDKHTMINKRVGVGTTLNMATPAGMALTGFSAVALLSIPVICIWIILLEFTPISLFVEQDRLIARQLKNDYVIETDAITEITLENELPRSGRISGTGMEHLQKGKFRNSVDGRIQLFLNPENEYYLRIVADDTIYYLGGRDDDQTQTVYEALTGK